MRRHYAVEFRASSMTPRSFEVSVSPRVYCVAGGRATQLSPSERREFVDDDCLLFDSKYGDLLMLTYVDLISGEYTAHVLAYDVPEDCEKLLEVVEAEGLPHGVYVLVYDAKEGSRVYAAPLSKGALRELSGILGISVGMIEKIVSYKSSQTPSRI